VVALGRGVVMCGVIMALAAMMLLGGQSFRGLAWHNNRLIRDGLDEFAPVVNWGCNSRRLLCWICRGNYFRRGRLGKPMGIAADIGLLSLRGRDPNGGLESWNWASAMGGVLKIFRGANVVDLRCSFVSTMAS